MLTTCAECGHRVSTSAYHCPHCGSHYFRSGAPAGFEYVIQACALVVFLVVAYTMLSMVRSF